MSQKIVDRIGRVVGGRIVGDAADNRAGNHVRQAAKDLPRRNKRTILIQGNLVHLSKLFSHLIITLVVGRLAECVYYKCAQSDAISVD